jgi:hypothetical protein
MYVQLLAVAERFDFKFDEETTQSAVGEINKKDNTSSSWTEKNLKKTKTGSSKT